MAREQTARDETWSSTMNRTVWMRTLKEITRKQATDHGQCYLARIATEKLFKTEQMPNTWCSEEDRVLIIRRPGAKIEHVP